jgi:hypothetical protein
VREYYDAGWRVRRARGAGRTDVLPTGSVEVRKVVAPPPLNLPVSNKGLSRFSCFFTASTQAREERNGRAAERRRPFLATFFKNTEETNDQTTKAPTSFSGTAHTQRAIDVAGAEFTRAPAAIVEAEGPFLLGIVPLCAAPNSRPAKANPALRMKTLLTRLRLVEDAPKLINRGHTPT